MMNREQMDAYMAKENRRASMMAQLRGHVSMEAGATEESLRAEYLELMGEPYRTAVEEATAIHAARQVEREAEQQARLDADEQAIALARTSGFMDCRAVRDALGFDGKKPNGSSLRFDGSGLPVHRRRRRSGRAPHPRRRASLLHRRRSPEDRQDSSHRCVRRCLRSGSRPTRNGTTPPWTARRRNGRP